MTSSASFLKGITAGALVTGALAWIADEYKRVLITDTSREEPVITEEVEEILTKKSPLLKHGVPRTSHTSLHTHFISCTGFRTKIPSWVLQHLTPDRKHIVERTGVTFKRYKDDIPLPFQARNADYFKSGWSRGHMCPAGDSRLSMEEMNDSFVLGANIVPQDLNNNCFYWNRVERWARSLTDSFSDVWILSGPLFMAPGQLDLTVPEKIPEESEPETSELSPAMLKSPKHNLSLLEIGDRHIPVPTHLFKAIIAEKPGQDGLTETYFAAFVFPNAPIKGDITLTDFQVSMSTLETWAGLEWIPKNELIVTPTDTDVVTKKITKKPPHQYRPDPFANLCGVVPCELMNADAHMAMHLTRDIKQSFKKWYAEKAMKQLRELGPKYCTSAIEEMCKEKIKELEQAEISTSDDAQIK